jgi:putative N6-adenine-specific DNA methylase
VTPAVSDAVPEAFAIVAPGLASLAAAELQALGVPPLVVESAGVAFAGHPEAVLRVNMHARLVSRVVVRLATFTARDFATLEKAAQRVPWARVLAPGETALLSVTCRKSRLYHSDAVAERVARGITRALPGVRTDVAARDDDDEVVPLSTATRVQRVLVRFDRDECTISADASGALLHRRGWRLATAKAPLRETLAAALLVASGWPGDAPLLDPLAGAGTIPIEAALMARRIAPGLSRDFACESWPGADRSLATRMRDAARAQVLPSAPAPIVCADRDPGAIEAARANAERAGVANDLQFVQQALSATSLDGIGPRGWLVTNPPWGIRTGDPATLRALWGSLGALVRAGGAAWTFTAVVPDPALAKELRLSLDRVLITTAGGRQVAFLRSRPSLR